MKATGESNLSDAVGGAAQQVVADLQSVGVEKRDGGLLHIAAENRAAFASAHISGGSDVVQRKFFRVMAVNIGNHVLLGQ